MKVVYYLIFSLLLLTACESNLTPTPAIPPPTSPAPAAPVTTPTPVPVVPVVVAPQPTATPPPVAQAIDLQTYTVQRGDNLYRIGLRYGVPWRRIAEANGILNPHLLPIDKVLTIPPPVR